MRPLSNIAASLFGNHKSVEADDRPSYVGPSASTLGLSLVGETQFKEARLFRKQIGDIGLPTGELIACDPLVTPDEAKPFRQRLPAGMYPVRLSIWERGDDQRVAFASIVFVEAEPTSWELLTVGDQSISTLGEGEIFGYGVDSGTGCFMDVAAISGLTQIIKERKDWYEGFAEEMQKTYRHTWSWMIKPLGGANLVAFSSGFGDGFYATYLGRTASGNVCTVVTDFGVCEV